MGRRQGPGLLRTAATTAVVVGTANTVNRAMAPKPQQVPMQAAPAAPPPPSGMTQDKVNQLQQIAQLRDQGILTDAEFEVQKAKILASV
jgi:hypothetical protein